MNLEMEQKRASWLVALVALKEQSNAEDIWPNWLYSRLLTLFLPNLGAKCPLAEDNLALQDQALLAVLDFLCACASLQPVHGLLFKPQDVRRRLLLLLEHVDFTKPLHLNMVSDRFKRGAALIGLAAV